MAFVIAALMAVGVGSLASPPGRAAGTTWESAQFHFGIQWQDPWQKVKDDSVPNDYDMVEIKAGDNPIWQDIYGLNWTESDPTTIAHKFVARFRDGFSDLKVTQEWSAGGSTGAFPEIITYTSTDGLPITETVLGRRFDSSPGVFLFTYRRAGNIDPTTLRDLNRLIAVRYPGSPVLPTPVITPNPTAVQTPTTAEVAAAKSLADRLRNSPVTRDELGGYGQYGGATLEPDASGSISQDVYFDTGGPAHLQGFGYWIYPNQEVARVQFAASMAQRQAKNFPVRIDVTNLMGPNAWLLTDSTGDNAGCYVLVDNVVALGTAVGGSSVAPSTAIACDMARIAVMHLAQFKVGPTAVSAQPTAPAKMIKARIVQRALRRCSRL
ncbi:MAG: hypothetical protein ACR2OO_06170 [Thermomicrobiales bacterium]